MKDRDYYIYYALLVLIFCFCTVSSSLICLVFTIAALLPSCLNKNWTPAIVYSFFLCASSLAIEKTLFLSSAMYVGLGALMVMITSKLFGSNSSIRNIPSIVIVLLCYVTIVDLMSSGAIHKITYYLLLTCCFLYNTNTEYENVKKKWSVAFSLSTMIISIIFLLEGPKFIQIYDNVFERTGWLDSNYFGMALGMGTLISVNELLFNKSGYSRIVKMFFIAVIAVSLPVLFLNASRGAMLSLFAGLAFSLYFSKVKYVEKVMIIGSIVVIIMFLHLNGYLDLFLYRVSGMQTFDSATGGRIDIWQDKIVAFWERGNIFNYLFGFGYDGGYNLTGIECGCHNDFVAFLVEYGIIGLGLFSLALFVPFRNYLSYSRENIFFLSSFVYLIVCFLSLEPFTLGVVSFFCFYAYIVFLSRMKSL